MPPVIAELDLASGTLFASDYRIERKLGQGGMGAIYVAHQLSTGRERALKLMHPSLVQDEGLRRRFEQEAKIGSRIKSDHVVQVIAAGIEPARGVPWIAMELLEGEDLGAYVERRGGMSLGEVAPILSELCHAVGAAHAVGVVHRDLKPENVFLARTHRQGAPVTVKLLDLGIAKMVADARVTSTGAVGTPLWMAPEQTAGQASAAVDVWALGLLVFWMLTGRVYWVTANDPALEASVMTVLREVVVEPLELASARAARFGCGEQIPSGFDAWFSRAVARDPNERFTDATQAEAAFRTLLSGVAETAVLPLALSAPLASSPNTERAVAPTTLAPPLVTRSGPPAQKRSLGWVATAGIAGVLAVVGARMMHAAADDASPAHVASASTSASVASPPSAAALAVPSGSSSAAPPALVDQRDDKTVWKIALADSPRRGPEDALVTLVEFGNFQCPFSKGAERAVRAILDEFPQDVRLVWKDDPLAVHSLAESAAQLAREARAEKGDAGFWAAHDAMIEPDFAPSAENLAALAHKLGLDTTRVAQVIADRRYLDGIDGDIDLADDFAVVGTPYFFVNGRRVLATRSLDKVRAVIAEELDRGRRSVASGVPRSTLYDRLLTTARGGLPLEIRRMTMADSRVASGGAEQPVVYLAEFCDYENTICRLIDPTLQQVVRKHASDLGFLWLDIPDPAHPEQSEEATRAAVAAHSVYKLRGTKAFLGMRKALFAASEWEEGLSEGSLKAYAKTVGVAPRELTAALDDPTEHADIDRVSAAARGAAITTLPGFLICGPDLCEGGGYYLSGGVALRAFEKRIKLVVAAHGGALPTTGG